MLLVGFSQVIEHFFAGVTKAANSSNNGTGRRIANYARRSVCVRLSMRAPVPAKELLEK